MGEGGRDELQGGEHLIRCGRGKTNNTDDLSFQIYTTKDNHEEINPGTGSINVHIQMIKCEYIFVCEKT